MKYMTVYIAVLALLCCLVSCSSHAEEPSNAVELTPEQLITNDRGWLMAFDNRRINVLVDNDATLLIDGDKIREEGECLYEKSGEEIGNVWQLGDSGRKKYIINSVDNVYKVIVSGAVKIEFMDSGYYNKIVEYESEKSVTYEIGSFDTMEISAKDKSGNMLEPTYVASEEELAKLNEDETVAPPIEISPLEG